MLYTDLQELKTVLEIDPEDTSEDKKLLFLVDQASDWIEQILNRPGMSYKARTEIYNGTNSPYLLLRSRPVYVEPSIQIWVDSSAYYGSASGSFGSNSLLTYGSDFCLELDQDNLNKSRSGIIIRINNVWPKPSVRQPGYLAPFITRDTGSIKVSYTAGYTVDDLPSVFRLACNFLVARLRYVFPLGVELGSESYQERHQAVITSQKEKLLTLVKPLIMPYRNYKF